MQANWKTGHSSKASVKLGMLRKDRHGFRYTLDNGELRGAAVYRHATHDWFVAVWERYMTVSGKAHNFAINFHRGIESEGEAIAELVYTMYAVSGQ